MFKYATSWGWIVCFILMLPLIYIMQTLVFGAPLLVTIIFPIQRGTTIWQSPLVCDSSFYIILSLAGMGLKGFIRPSEDEENPYSSQTTTVPITVVYFLFLLLLAIWLFLLTSSLDQQILWFSNAYFQLSIWIAFIPLFLALLAGFIVFLVKAIREWRSFVKKHDPNGDAKYQAIYYTALCVFVVLGAIASILGCIGSSTAGYPWFIVPLPIAIGYIIIFVISILPFLNLFQKKTGAKSRKEMICAL